MVRKLLFLGFIIGVLAYPQNGECQGMGVITVTRHKDLLIPIPGFTNMEIYINGNLYSTPGRRPKPIPLKRGETATIPLHQGAHSITVRIAFLQSEPIQFTLSDKSIVFIANYDYDEEKLYISMQE
jgi:hypothetical protein